MKIRLNGIYKEQYAKIRKAKYWQSIVEEYTKYNFASMFTSGKILDVTYGKYLDYSKSKLLLKKGVKEIWSFDTLNDEEFLTLRRLDNDGKIIYQIKDKKELDKIKFDTVLAFNILSITDNIDNTLKFIFNCLSPNGNAVISIINDKTSLKIHDALVTLDLNYITKDDFEKRLQVFFKNISFFSQGNMDAKIQEKPNIKIQSNTGIKIQEYIKSIFKIKLRAFFLKSEKRTIFYIKYIQPKQRLIRKFRNDRKRKRDLSKDYNVIPYLNGQKPLCIIALCRNSLSPLIETVEK